jgi:hypothetical protein
MADQSTEGGAVTRLSFIKASAGAAAAVTAVAAPVAIASAHDGAVVTDPSSPTPGEPVVAYVRDAKRGEVTVVSGTSETTYRDRALVRRLLAAAPQDSNANGDDGSVVTP